VNEQLDLFGAFAPSAKPQPAVPLPTRPHVPSQDPVPERKVISTAPLEALAKALLMQLGYESLAAQVVVRWNPRMRTTAGIAIPARQLIMLNPKVYAFDGELERTMRHELAHLLAHHRAGRRRIAAHGVEWRQACADLGISEETRCHTLPLPKRTQRRKHSYACPACGCTIHRVRPIRRKSACLACCKAHNRGEYDERFRLRRLTAK
jgi:predicted SprT family Zn-dependent metalloprotease